MRISDWSSDVCSSDLRDRDAARAVEIEEVEALDERRGAALIAGEAVGDHEESTSPPGATLSHSSGLVASITRTAVTRILRSEEHTSELQSLMRISYAVFCLKKKKIKSLRLMKNLTTKVYNQV